MNRNGQIDFESADRVVSNDVRYVTYNGENRPVLWVRESDNMAIAMSYDHMGRRGKVGPGPVSGDDFCVNVAVFWELTI